MIAVTADTNIYISALNFGGLPRQFIVAAQHKRFRLDVSAAILEELTGTLREKFDWPEEQLQEELIRLGAISTLATPTQSLSVVADDPDDDRILECAVAAGSHYLVSGDNHLLRLGSYAGIRIVRVAEFMNLLSP